MSVNVKRRLIKKSKLLGSDEDSPRKKIHTENDEKIRSSSVESNKIKENNDRVIGPESGYDKGEFIEEGNINDRNKVEKEIIIHLNENRKREGEMAGNTVYWELKKR